MTAKLKPIKDQVWVITGASSGIGLCTARLAARQGVSGLVLVARSGQAIEELAQEINQRAGRQQAVAVAADVADYQQLARASQAAQLHFGGFTTWVNNAGVSIYGRLLQVADADHRRLFETNFWGLVNGSKIACEHLAQRPGGGCLINIGSTLSERAIPVQGMYSASKHAVKGYTDALRMELEHDGAPVQVTLIKPAAIDTPYTEHAKNYMEDAPNNPPPVYAPDLVAETILYAAENPVRDLFVGGAGKAFQLAEHYAPGATDAGMEAGLFQIFHSGKPRYERDALHQAGNSPLRERGDYEGMVRETSLYTSAATHPKISLAALLVGGLAAAGAAWALANRERFAQPVPDNERVPYPEHESEQYLFAEHAGGGYRPM